MLENVTLVEEIGSNKYVAPEGKVITNYKEGDSQIVFSESLIFAKGSTPSDNFYLMDKAEAEQIKAKFDEEAEKLRKQREHEFRMHEEHEDIEEVSEVEDTEEAEDTEEVTFEEVK